jgi:hypothetical protein
MQHKRLIINTLAGSIYHAGHQKWKKDCRRHLPARNPIQKIDQLSLDVFLLVVLVAEPQEAASAVAFEQQEDAGASCLLLTKVAGVEVLVVLPVVLLPLAFWQALAQSAGWH